MITENSISERSQSYEKYRKKFSFLVICKGCTRSFDSAKKERGEARCKFCASENIIAKGKGFFRYYCPSCEKSCISEEERDVCKKCGIHYLHIMRIRDMSKSDRLEIQKAKIRRFFANCKKSRRINIKINLAEKMKAPLNFRAIKFSLRQNKEEMPTY